MLLASFSTKGDRYKMEFIYNEEQNYYDYICTTNGHLSASGGYESFKEMINYLINSIDQSKRFDKINYHQTFGDKRYTTIEFYNSLNNESTHLNTKREFAQLGDENMDFIELPQELIKEIKLAFPYATPLNNSAIKMTMREVLLEPKDDYFNIVATDKVWLYIYKSYIKPSDIGLNYPVTIPCEKMVKCVVSKSDIFVNGKNTLMGNMGIDYPNYNRTISSESNHYFQFDANEIQSILIEFNPDKNKDMRCLFQYADGKYELSIQDIETEKTISSYTLKSCSQNRTTVIDEFSVGFNIIRLFNLLKSLTLNNSSNTNLINCDRQYKSFKHDDGRDSSVKLGFEFRVIGKDNLSIITMPYLLRSMDGKEES